MMLMNTDKLVGGRVEVTSQSPCRRHPLVVGRGKLLAHGIGSLFDVGLLTSDLLERRSREEE